MDWLSPRHFLNSPDEVGELACVLFIVNVILIFGEMGPNCISVVWLHLYGVIALGQLGSSPKPCASWFPSAFNHV